MALLLLMGYFYEYGIQILCPPLKFPIFQSLFLPLVKEVNNKMVKKSSFSFVTTNYD